MQALKVLTPPKSCASDMPLIGVDVAKDTLVTAVHASGVKPATIANTPSAIKAWLRTLPAHCAIANGVHTDLQFVPIDARGDFIELSGCKQWRARVAGVARIILQHQRG